MTAPTFLGRYRAFGLDIESEIALPAPIDLRSPERPADLVIHHGGLIDPIDLDPAILRISAGVSIVPRGNEWLLFVTGLNPADRFTASLRPGRIEIGWSRGVYPADVARHLMGSVMAAYMLFCGRICLHGSAIALDDRIIAFLGASGRGKSTLAAALIGQGGRLITEELIVLDQDPVRAMSGIPAVKLSAVAAARLGWLDRCHPVYAHPDYADEGFVANFDDATQFSPGCHGIDLICLLAPRHGGAQPQLSRRLGPGAAAAALADSGYWAQGLPPAARAGLLRAALRIAAQRRVCRLSLPDNLERLSGLGDWLRQHGAIGHEPGRISA